ncbi:putative acyltransferase [Terriglobus roseus DSM 18391]|uniref:Putative acyltransferase n=2 Tax=Terriglobus roseus TaxID=392734 RepID=I3ZC07_TERRK|nr:putative acyltransferase [Terriglobus roseus DSM 18391]
MVPVAAEATQRFDGVDVLRGISIVAVVLLHGYLRLFLEGHSARGLLPLPLFRLLFLNGGNGVTVFFAVSGFLITYTSLRRFGSLAAMRAKVFYRIRFARIAPLLLLVLAVLSGLHLAHASGFHVHTPGVTLPRALFSALTFHLNWLEARYGYLPANWDVMWSLSVEEMFYLFFPLVCVALLRARRGMLYFVGLAVLLMVLAPIARTAWAPTELYAEKSYLGGMGSIAMGCLAALVVTRLQRRRTVPSDVRLLMLAWMGAILMFVAAPPFPIGRWHKYLDVRDLDDSLLTFGTCVVMAALVLRNRAGRRWTAPLRWFGRHSYEVYLTHEFVVVWITMLALHVGTTYGRGLHYGVLAWIALMLLLSAPLGWLVAKFFSEPLNRRLRLQQG